MLTIIVVVDKSITCFQPLFHKQIYRPLDQNENDMSQMIHYQIINIDSSVMEHVIWIQVLEVMIVFFDGLPSIIIKIGIYHKYNMINIFLINLRESYDCYTLMICMV